MTTAELIDAAIKWADNVDAADLDNTGRRQRMLQFAQETLDEVWNFREWRFKQKVGSLSVPASGQVSVPTDFNDLGEHGGIFEGSSKFLEVFPQEMQSNLQSGTGDGGFSLYGQDATTGLQQIQFVARAATYTIYYNRNPPTLVDADDATSNLQFIPAAYHNTVLLAGTVARAKRSLGVDPAAQAMWDGSFQRGLAYMVLRERPRKSAVQRLPKAVLMQW